MGIYLRYDETIMIAGYIDQLDERGVGNQQPFQLWSMKVPPQNLSLQFLFLIAAEGLNEIIRQKN